MRRSLRPQARNNDVVDSVNVHRTIDVNPSYERLRESYGGASGVVERTVVAPKTEEQRRVSRRMPLSERTRRSEVEAYETFQNETGRGQRRMNPQMNPLQLRQARAAERQTREGQSRMTSLVRRTQKEISALDVEGDKPRDPKKEAKFIAAMNKAEREVKNLGRAKKMSDFYGVLNELEDLEYEIAMEYIEGRENLAKSKRQDALTDLEVDYGKKRKKLDKLQGVLQKLMAEKAEIISRREAEAKQAAIAEQKSEVEDNRQSTSKPLPEKQKPLTAAEKRKAQQEAEMAIIMQARQSIRGREGMEEMQAKFRAALAGQADRQKSLGKTPRRKDPGEGTSKLKPLPKDPEEREKAWQEMALPQIQQAREMLKAKMAAGMSMHEAMDQIIPQRKASGPTTAKTPRTAVKKKKSTTKVPRPSEADVLEEWDEDAMQQILRAREMLKAGIVPEIYKAPAKARLSLRPKIKPKTPKTPKKARASQAAQEDASDADDPQGWNEDDLAAIATARQRLKGVDIETLFPLLRKSTAKTPAKASSKMSIKKAKKEKKEAEFDVETGQWNQTLQDQIKQAREVYKTKQGEVAVDTVMSKSVTQRGKTPLRKTSKISLKKKTKERASSVEPSEPQGWDEDELAQIRMAREIMKARQSMAPEEVTAPERTSRLRKPPKLGAKRKPTGEKDAPVDYEAQAKAWEEQARAETAFVKETARLGTTAVERALAEQAAARRAIIMKANEMFAKSLKAADMSLGDSLTERDVQFTKHKIDRKSLPAIPARGRPSDVHEDDRRLSLRPEDVRSKSVSRGARAGRRGAEDRETITQMSAELYTSQLAQPQEEVVSAGMRQLKPLRHLQAKKLKDKADKDFRHQKKLIEQSGIPEEHKRDELAWAQLEHGLKLHVINNMDKYKQLAVQQYNEVIQDILNSSADAMIKQEDLDFMQGHLKDMLNNIEEYAGMPRPPGVPPISDQAKLQVADLVHNALAANPTTHNERLSMALQRSMAREMGYTEESLEQRESMQHGSPAQGHLSRVSEFESPSRYAASGIAVPAEAADRSDERRSRSKSISAKKIKVRPKHFQADAPVQTDDAIYNSPMANENVANALDKSPAACTQSWKLEENSLQAMRLKKQLEKRLEVVSKETPITKEVLKALETGDGPELPISDAALQSLATGLRLDKDVELASIATEAARRSSSIKQQLETISPEVQKKVPVSPHQSPAQAIRAENIFQMMMNQSEGVDLEAPPDHVVPLLVPPEGPHLKLAGKAVESEGIMIDIIPMKDINAMDDTAATEITAVAGNQPDHKFPAEPLAAKRLPTIRIEIEPPDDATPVDFLQENILLHSFGVETFFQSRGTTHPKWFPGIYTVFPEDDPKVILKKSPSEVLLKAWEMLKPNYDLRSK